jgi:hypothetical protein
MGVIQANTEEIVKLPFTFAIGRVDIIITANEIHRNYSAFALGPIFLNVNEV